MKHNLKWFNHRIGKKIYSDDFAIIIKDEDHAKRLFINQYDIGEEYEKSKKRLKKPN